MCGISMIIESGGTSGTVSGALAAMHAAQAHRGPDGEGFLRVTRGMHATRSLAPLPDFDWNDPATRVAAAFRHLKIRDPGPAAEQPLSSPDGLQWVVLNGEIYNDRELREELAGKGHQFVSASDTEVALAAWREWGESCFARFNGMWAILIVDLPRGILAGSRDRLGIKPLFYMHERSRLSFASEPAALARAAEGGARMNIGSVREFLRGFPPASPHGTFFGNIHPVPPGTRFTVDLRESLVREPRFERFWDLRDYIWEDGGSPGFGAAVEELRALLRDAVGLRLAGSTQMGCLLSGGLDTSMVASLMAEAMKEQRPGEKPRSYSIVFEDPSMNEAPFIWSVAKKAGLLSRKLTLTPALCWASIDDAVRAQGEPLLGQDLIALHHAYRMAREDGTAVILEGQGADEMLGGMPAYAWPVFRELLFGLKLPAFFSEINAHARRYGRSRLGIIRRDVFGRPGIPRSGRGAPAYPWLIADGASVEAAEVDGLLESSRDRSLLNRHLFREMRVTNIPAVLLHQDRCSMAHAVESRAPYLDHRIVEYCFRLPSAFKVRNGERKRLLLHAAKSHLPDAVLNRTDKKTPISRIDWMPLRETRAGELREMAASAALRECPLLDGAAVAPWIESYLSGGHGDLPGVWRLYTFWRWLEICRPA